MKRQNRQPSSLKVPPAKISTSLHSHCLFHAKDPACPVMGPFSPAAKKITLCLLSSRLQPKCLRFKKDHFISENLPMWSDVGPTNIGLVTACPAENQMEPNPCVYQDTPPTWSNSACETRKLSPQTRKPSPRVNCQRLYTATP